MKFLTGLCVCLLFTGSAFGQEETPTEVAPAQAPSSVIDESLTTEAQATPAVQEITSQLVDPNSDTLVDPSVAPSVMNSMSMDQTMAVPGTVMPIQTYMPAQQQCGCSQTSYQPTVRMIQRPQMQTYRVYTGNNFNRAPIQQIPAYGTYNVPSANVYTSMPSQQYVPQQYQYQNQQQYYYVPQQQMVPMRRGGVFINRFRR